MGRGYELLLALDPDPGRYVSEDPHLLPGDHVKVGFRVDQSSRRDPRGEWMFLEVTAVDGIWPGTVYRGELCNTPFYIDPATLCLGHPVTFRPEHIYQVIHDSPDRPEWGRETPP